jgi:hypothetical protein
MHHGLAIVLLLVAAAVTAAALYLAGTLGMVGYAGAREVVLARFGSADWHATTGVIVSSDASRRCGRWGDRHHVAVRYAYEVGGRTHVGERIRFGFIACEPSPEARAMAADYPVGRRVAVHFDPADPADAVLRPGELRPGTVTGTLLLLAVPAVTVVVYALFLRGPWRRRGGLTDLGVRLRRRTEVDRSVRAAAPPPAPRAGDPRRPPPGP